MGRHRSPIEDLWFRKEELLTLPVYAHETEGLGVKISDDGRLNRPADLEGMGVAAGDHGIRGGGELRLRIGQRSECPHPDILADGALA